MTRKPSAQLRRRPRAFTLIEIITVVGIIALIMAIALPMLARTLNTGRKTRAAADLQAISTGLEAYRTDFGDYPRGGGDNTGFLLLGKALIGPGPAGGFPTPPAVTLPAGAGTVTSAGTPGTTGYVEYVAIGRPNGEGGFSASSAPPNAEWVTFPVTDGKDGPGFRARVGGGQTYGPYLQDGKFRVRGLAILDLWDNPVLYFPALPRKPVQTPPWPLLAPLTTVTPPAAPLYNAAENIVFFLRPGEAYPGDAPKALKRMDAVMVAGSTNFNGIIDGTEKPATTNPFLLWSAGADGNFGATFAGADPTADEIKKVDDVTNFTTGQ